MNTESPDELDRLLRDWSVSREADDQHTTRLANQILAAVREMPVPASISAAPMSLAFWGDKLMIGGGLLLFLILAGCVFIYNLTTGSPNNFESTRPIASRDVPARSNDAPAAASFAPTELTAKRRLLAETNALFDNQLDWLADGEHEVSLQVRNQADSGGGAFMLVRVVVAQRTSPEAPWSTIWQTDVIARNEALVEVAPKQLDGSSFALWTYVMSDGAVAVDMDLTLGEETQQHSASSTVLHAGQPTRVGCSTEDGVEQCVFQTVMPLSSSRI